MGLAQQAVALAPPPPAKKKNQPCWYFTRGLCKNGATCQWNHDAVECAAKLNEEGPKDGSDAYKSKMCTFVTDKMGCKFGDLCWYAHNPGELRGADPAAQALAQQE